MSTTAQEIENPYAEWGEDSYTGEQPQAAAKRKEKQYYWLKLKDGFFESKHIKALRLRENGDTMTIIYLSMQLKAMRSGGIIGYEGILPSYEAELALEIGESVEIVKETLSVLSQLNLIEIWDDQSVYMACKRELLDYGSETAAAERMRRARSKNNHP